MTSFKSSAVISDSLGNLLFFTDGKRVWNRNFTLMPNANSLEGDLGVTQPALIIPVPFNGGGFTGQDNAYGYMKASPDGSKIVSAVSGLNKIELFDFDNSTGVISNPRSFTTADPGISPYGIEFSSDNKKLYFTLLQLTGDGPPTYPSKIYQFDLPNGFGNPVLIDSVSGIRIAGLQLATDGRIYVSRTLNLTNKKDSLDVIYNPTRPRAECNYNQLNNMAHRRFSLDGRNSIYGLPTLIQSYFDIPMFTWDSVCFRDVIHFKITNKANIDSVLWNFGDGMTSSSMDPTHFFDHPGTYTVKLTETYRGTSYSDSNLVTIHKSPYLNLGDTIHLYSGFSILLHAGGGYTNYSWSTGSGDSVINVETEGTYSVRVEDHNCCINSDTVYVMLFKFYAPSAFTPNGDGKNDVFRLVGPYRNIKLNLYIYTRWGELVFTSDNINKAWDGSVGGMPCPVETYVWLANIKFPDQDIISKKDIVLKGSVTLLR